MKSLPQYPTCGRDGIELVDALPADCPYRRRGTLSAVIADELDRQIQAVARGGDVENLRFFVNACHGCSRLMSGRHARHIERLRRRGGSR